GRAAGRGGLGGEGGVGGGGGGGRARTDAAPHGVRARQTERQAGQARPRPQPARHQSALPARSRHLRSEGAFQAGTRLQDGALQGLLVRRRRNPLVLRQGASAWGGGRAGGGHLPFRRRAQGLFVRGDQRRRPRPPRHLYRRGGNGGRRGRGERGGRGDRR